MTKDEALKLALEALEGADMIDCDMREAITAIKEALAQPEQEPVTWRYKIVDVFGRPAWTLKTPKSDTRVLESQPLYTTPPQRTWVGLTPQERDEINEQVYGAVPHHVAFHAAIEAKLRSKND